MEAKEIRMYVFFILGSIVLVDYLKTQVIGVVKDSARAAGNGVGGGIIDGLAGVFSSNY